MAFAAAAGATRRRSAADYREYRCDEGRTRAFVNDRE